MSTSNYYGNDNDITLQQPSVLDLSPLPKPKRPLSGYNLYYRYKRIKILEATSNYDDTNDDSKSIVIKNIIMCLPGLESIPRHDTMYLSKESIDELRASKIRLVMTGDKLLPNENTRSRLHRKLHGMGFVEMGTIMRQMWANADDHTKKVFCDLADLGRLKYRVRLAEWKEREDLITANGGNRGGQEDQGKGKKKTSSKKGPTKRQSQDSQAYHAATTAAAAASSTEVTPQVAAKPFFPFPFAVSTPLLHKQSIPSTFVGQHSITPSFNANYAERAYFAQAAMEAAVLASATSSSYEPLSIPTETTKKARTHEYERRVSVDANTVISNEMELYLRSNTGLMIPPPPLFLQERSSPHRLVSSNSFSSDQEVTPSSSIEREDEDMPQDLDVSAQDFMDLIAHLDSSTESNPEVKQVFGKPMFDVETMSPSIGSLLPSREEEEVVAARMA